ncbi:hypothetical protein [Candidatus Clostridium stratigraminis]|uniref:DUF3955 domain-containing protein n=1 Tax=Candidatus Clostridium stratigraminis TaxID=3381661 RepID=A0ABW8T1Z0_9CLOT
MKQNTFIIIFLIDLIFIFIIPSLSKVFTSDGSTLDYLIPYCASLISFLTIGILVGVLCIKKICQK